MTPCLSVVIPVYNADKYLPACLNSLLASDGIGNAEIILIDDGSTDDSASVADDYSAKHRNIRVIHKQNEGPSEARNTGLRESNGKYVFFCDADDTVDTSLFSGIIRRTEVTDVDIILWDSELCYETWNPQVPKNRGFFAHAGLEKLERIYTGKELVETSLRNSGDFVATVWLGAYRRDFLLCHDLFFEKGIVHEDELWAPQVYLNAGSVLYIPEKVYRYRIHDDSIMNPKDGDRTRSAESLLYIYPYLYKYYDEKLAGDPELRELIEANLTKRYVHMIYKYHIFNYGYAKIIDKKLLWRTAGRFSDKILVLMLYVLLH